MKNLALLAHVSIEVDEEPVLKLLHILGVEEFHLEGGGDLYSSTTPSKVADEDGSDDKLTQFSMVMLNGRIVGGTRDPG